MDYISHNQVKQVQFQLNPQPSRRTSNFMKQLSSMQTAAKKQAEKFSNILENPFEKIEENSMMICEETPMTIDDMEEDNLSIGMKNSFFNLNDKMENEDFNFFDMEPE